MRWSRFATSDPGFAADSIDVLQGRIVEAMLADGYAVASSTVLNARPVLRFCTINPRTTDAEMIETVRRMQQLGRSLSEPML